MSQRLTRDVNLDLDLVRAFVAVVEARNFTKAGRRLGRTQSAVSLQIKRLEDQVGATLLSRDPRHVTPTREGDAFLLQARRLLRINDEILSDLRGDDLEGEVRLGAPEDFATVHLPEILGDFTRAHSKVAMSVTCDLTLNLLEKLREGELDLALVKREPLGPDQGVRVWREHLVWVAADVEVLERSPVASLVLAPSPCVYRRRALVALDAVGKPWRAAYTSPSLAGQYAALRAGLGVTVLPREMVPPDLTVLGDAQGLPPLPDAEIALLKARTAVPVAAEALAEFILTALDRRQAMLPGTAAHDQL